jgi:hypothetical protein
MNWNTYPKSESISRNVEIMMFDYLIDGTPDPYPAVGDTLTIEHPSNARAKGIIKNVSDKQIEVEINNQLSTWILVNKDKNYGRITLNYVVA